ncbi:hypothetical protein A2U01_0096950, partial [Trifolium medium]|nr:hypothetical protein [Trifolium medium]
MTQMVLNNGWRASKEFSELCVVWMSIGCNWEATFSMMKLITGGGTQSKD